MMELSIEPEEEISLEEPPSSPKEEEAIEIPLDLTDFSASSGSIKETVPGEPGELGEEVPVSAIESPVLPTPPQRKAGHPFGKLFAKLWDTKGSDSRVEIHLAAGGVLLPDGFVRDLSQQDHLVVFTKDADGTHTLTVVPWDSVARVILRGVKQLPAN
jgi:hypothetical protein